MPEQGETAIAWIKRELRNDEDTVIASMQTDRQGQYSFDQFGETGDYQRWLAPAMGSTVTGPNPSSSPPVTWRFVG